MTCKDCYHYDICQYHIGDTINVQECCDFKDKSTVIELPCEVARIPAADVAPVVHGRWLEWEKRFVDRFIPPSNRLGVFCTACDKCADSKFDYCPNCGAKMDGDINDG